MKRIGARQAQTPASRLRTAVVVMVVLAAITAFATLFAGFKVPAAESHECAPLIVECLEMVMACEGSKVTL